MSKIAIISQPDRGVIIDVAGCSSLEEAREHLISTLQISSDFWKNMSVELNLGKLVLTPGEVAQIISLANAVGVEPSRVYAQDEITISSLAVHKIAIAAERPLSIGELPAGGELRPSRQESSPAKVSGDGSGAELEVMIAGPSASPAPKARLSSRQEPAPKHLASGRAAVPQNVLYLRQTLRSGQAVSHSGHLVIVGDVNPGAEVVAAGDITVWGALRGIAHAGIGGNTAAEIRALRIEAIQLRIAHAIARSPDRPFARTRLSPGPETARIVDGSIRIQADNPE